MEAGRKFTMAMTFLFLSALEAFVAMFLGKTLPDNLMSMQGGVVMAFIAGNAAVSWAFAGAQQNTTTVNETITREVKARRAAGDGTTEDTP